MGYPVKGVQANIVQNLTSSPNGGERELARNNIGVASQASLAAAKTEIREGQFHGLLVQGTVQQPDGNMLYTLSKGVLHWGHFTNDLDNPSSWRTFDAGNTSYSIPIPTTRMAGTMDVEGGNLPLRPALYWMHFTVRVRVTSPAPHNVKFDIQPMNGSEQSYLINAALPAGSDNILTFGGVYCVTNSVMNVRMSAKQKDSGIYGLKMAIASLYIKEVH